MATGKPSRPHQCTESPAPAGGPGERAGRFAFAATPAGSVKLLQRSFALLRVIAAERGGGLRLTEIAERSQLHLATVHRLLRALEAERAVLYDPFSRVYYIGYDFLEPAQETFEARLKAHFHPLLQMGVDWSSDTANLATRHGNDALYLDVLHGEFPPGNSMVVGGRRPLGVGPNAIVLFGVLPLREQQEVIAANARRYLRFNAIDSRQVRAALQQFRRDGYAYGCNNIVPGVGAVAVPVEDARGKTVASLSLSSTMERLTAERQHQVAAWLLAQVAKWPPFDPQALVSGRA